MSTLTLSSIPVHLIPPELIDPFADDDAPGLVAPEEPDAPREPRLPFAEWIRFRASLLRLEADGAAASWLARKVDELAAMAELLSAATPDDFDARLDTMEDDRAALLRSQGFDSAVGFGLGSIYP